jgi:hypothetical protein
MSMTTHQYEAYVPNIAKYSSVVNEDAVRGIVNHCGIALRVKSRDPSWVAASDPTELATVRNSFLKKKLQLSDSDDDLDRVIQDVLYTMRAETNKPRVTVYYLLAKHYGKLDLFIKTKTNGASRTTANRERTAPAA